MEDSLMFDTFSVRSSIKDNYTVHFINDLEDQFTTAITQGNSVFIVDEKLKNIFAKKLEQVIELPRTIFITCDEAHKTIDYAQDIIRILLSKNIRKNEVLIAIGGGITQDLVAFISSILFRGVDWKFYPTTLLSQCDSCIGSKSSINLDEYKNLIGTFNPPSEIFIYSGFLTTLTQSEIRSGIGEMLHYFFIEGIKLANEVALNFNRLIEDRPSLAYYINNSLRIKKAVIEIDEYDTSTRHIFNYGHTFGHAIETISNHQIPHGQAISLGMDLANYISFSFGMLSETDFKTMHNILTLNLPPFQITKNNIELYCNALSKDKKNKGNKLGCILSRGPGKVEKVYIEIDNKLKELFINYSDRYNQP